MGYHIIIRNENGINRYYIDDLNQLINIDDIDENSIIYQGEETWKPYESVRVTLFSN